MNKSGYSSRLFLCPYIYILIIEPLEAKGAVASNLRKISKMPSHKLKYRVIYAFKRLCMWKSWVFKSRKNDLPHRVTIKEWN